VAWFGDRRRASACGPAAGGPRRVTARVTAARGGRAPR
jgi:hypothetical protein